MRTRRRGSAGRGFTLIELLVVLLIILLVSAVTLPVVLPALQHRQVGEGARLLQAVLAGSRDAAVRANAPRGIRLLSDPTLNQAGGAFASNRLIPIEPGPDYSEGRIAIKGTLNTNPPNTIYGGVQPAVPAEPPWALRIEEERFDTQGLPAARTSWFWNLRLGDKIRLGESGRYYTIVGPYWTSNPELFVNVGPPGTMSPIVRFYNATPFDVEYLLVSNGQDDNQNGYVDEGFDGIDNNNNGHVDWNFNLDALEFELESFVGPQLIAGTFTNQPYHVQRRPVPSPGAREVTLPSDVVIDMTTLVNPLTGQLNPNSERSRLPIDLMTGYVDILIAPNGQVMQAAASSNAAPPVVLPFYHFWIAERADVFEPVPPANASIPYWLPMPQGARNYPHPNDPNPRFLKGERRLVTLFPRTGQITTNSIENFDTNPQLTYSQPPFSVNPPPPYYFANMPFLDAQAGLREEIK
jgi:prepilin-type N-terminal cleavage/methylation domain-containing protein